MWNNLQAARATPPTPTYPSSHAQMGGAGAESFKLCFRKDFKNFTKESSYLPGVERTYSSFTRLSDDIAVSRIFAGFQFRSDVEPAEIIVRVLKKRLPIMISEC